MRRLILAAALFAGLMAAPANAQDEDLPTDELEARYRPSFNACLDSPAGGSTQGMIDCITEERAFQDGELNKAYKASMETLNSRQQAKLKTAQRAWIGFRDAVCAAEQDEDWGTISRLNAHMCLLRRTVERTIELQGYPDPPTDE